MKCRILIIDDDIGTSKVLAELFMMKNLDATVVHTGRDALAELERNPGYDIALIDIHLPDIEGTEVLIQCKKNFPDLECIIITGDVSIQIAVDSLQKGAVGYFVKPLILSDVNNRIEDILEKRRLRHEVEMLNELPRLILNSIEESISIINVEDLSIMSANKAFLRETGLREIDVVGKACFTVSHRFNGPCDTEGHVCPLRETIRTGKYAVAEQVFVDQAGENKYFEVASSPINDEHGKVFRVVHVSRDITDRKRLESTLIEEKKLLEKAHSDLARAYSDLKLTQARVVQQEKLATIGQLAAGVAHEINNPMGFIASNLSTLNKYVERIRQFVILQDTVILEANIQNLELTETRKKLKLDYIYGDIENLVAESLEGAARVKEIVQNLKSFSRIDENERVPADINKCLKDTLNMVWNEIKYKATVARDFAELPMVSCLPRQLNQVFMNLLVNAAQAIEKQGEIGIKTWVDEGFVNISISDTGCGIQKENLGKIFEPFFTTKEAGKGTGLGMSIALDIVKKHDGELFVESEEGKGSVFTVRLPVK